MFKQFPAFAKLSAARSPDEISGGRGLPSRGEFYYSLHRNIGLHVEAWRMLSVVICAYRRRQRLLQAVRSCAEQTLSLEEYEVVVVNNDSEDASLGEAIVDLRSSHFAAHPDHLRLVMCPILGLSHARNTGITEARGEVVCFIDDDAIASPNWLEQVRNAFHDHPMQGAAGGTIRLKIPDPRPAPLLQELEGYWSAFIPPYTEYTEVQDWWQFPWGCNWFAKRQALIDIGGFPHQYGRRGKGFDGGEEIVAAILIQRLGFHIAVVPQACVTHDVEPERFTWRHVRLSIVRGLRGRYQLEQDQYLPWSMSISKTLRSILNPNGGPSIKGPVNVRWRVRWYKVRAYCELLLLQVRNRWYRQCRRARQGAV